jgi:hypothetical protein
MPDSETNINADNAASETETNHLAMPMPDSDTKSNAASETNIQQQYI